LDQLHLLHLHQFLFFDVFLLSDSQPLLVLELGLSLCLFFLSLDFAPGFYGRDDLDVFREDLLLFLGLLVALDFKIVLFFFVCRSIFVGLIQILSLFIRAHFLPLLLNDLANFDAVHLRDFLFQTAPSLLRKENKRRQRPLRSKLRLVLLSSE
jgi:hypothetical protein